MLICNKVSKNLTYEVRYWWPISDHEVWSVLLRGKK